MPKKKKQSRKKSQIKVSGKPIFANIKKDPLLQKRLLDVAYTVSQENFLSDEFQFKLFHRGTEKVKPTDFREELQKTPNKLMFGTLNGLSSVFFNGRDGGGWSFICDDTIIFLMELIAKDLNVLIEYGSDSNEIKEKEERTLQLTESLGKILTVEVMEDFLN